MPKIPQINFSKPKYPNNIEIRQTRESDKEAADNVRGKYKNPIDTDDLSKVIDDSIDLEEKP